MKFDLTFFRIATHAIEIQWTEEISETVLFDIIGFKKQLEKEPSLKDCELFHTYSALLIYWKSNHESINEKTIEWLKGKYKTSDSVVRIKTKTYTLPVCYDSVYGIDMDLLAEQKSLDVQTIIQLHSSTTYLVYFIGFQPGFLYLGGLNPLLFSARKKTPRLKIPSGSVGIGGKQTGIYPFESPGGWNIIGNCPVPLFQAEQKPPIQIEAGDRIVFQPISQEKHEKFKARIKENRFKFGELYSIQYENRRIEP